MLSTPLIRRQIRTHSLRSLRCVQRFQICVQLPMLTARLGSAILACAQDSESDGPPNTTKDPWRVLEAESLLASGLLLPGAVSGLIRPTEQALLAARPIQANLQPSDQTGCYGMQHQKEFICSRKRRSS